MEYKLEVVALPVSGVDWAKAYYERIWFHRDSKVGDIRSSPSGRLVFFNDRDGNGWAGQQFPDRN
jgi:hypothetical protein